MRVADGAIGGGEILDREAERLEDGDGLRVRAPALCAREHLTDLGADMRVGDRAFGPCQEVFAAFDGACSRESTKSSAPAMIAEPSSRALGELAPTALMWQPGLIHSGARMGLGDAVTVQITSASATAASAEAHAFAPMASASASALAMERPQMLKRASGRIVRIASIWQRAWWPVPRIATSFVSHLARASVAAAEVAAVRRPGIAVASTTALSSPVAPSRTSIAP